ncbi:unnamed protein product [Caenorhabditis angaria]|uniref:Uncharacterized protein n=1 Tax=Caenorhabditis angaria TaxID=860376 RepID=A0A9P1MSU1_9PELO|nr:unnamed protein product [Caenorhabditis angaria]
MRRKRKDYRKIMKSRIDEFHKSCEFTNVSENQLNWPIRRGARIKLVSGIDEIPVIPNPCHLLDSVSSMMFSYGDSPNPDPLAVHLVLTSTIEHIIKYCNTMWRWAKRSNRSIITHVDLLNLLNKNKSRFHRFVKYYFCGETHQKINSSMMTTLQKQYEQNEQFRTFCDSPKVENDENFQNISERFNKSVSSWNDDILYDWQQKRTQSFCCPDSNISSFYAYKFHEAIGLPPLEIDLIYYIDFIAREYIMEIVHKALLIGDSRNISKLTCDEYMDSVGSNDILFNIPSNFPLLSRKRKTSSSSGEDENGKTENDEMYRVLEEIHADWYNKHHAPVIIRQSFDPAVWFKMRRR